DRERPRAPARHRRLPPEEDGGKSAAGTLRGSVGEDRPRDGPAPQGPRRGPLCSGQRTVGRIARIRITTMNDMPRHPLSAEAIEKLRAEEKDWEANEVARFLA